MAQVNARIELPGTIYEAETRWYDTDRWSGWVDQLARVTEVRGDWPKAGAEVVWESGPAGRGVVLERVAEYEPRVGQTNEVEDDSIVGRQRVSFAPAGEGAELVLNLDYRLKRRSPVSALINFLFIKRLMRASLDRTLEQFRAEVSSAH